MAIGAPREAGRVVNVFLDCPASGPMEIDHPVGANAKLRGPLSAA
jgi:hypothetical protein